jgi:outer membrane protein TolC
VTAQQSDRLTLDEAVRHALVSAPALTAAVEARNAAAAGLREARASRLPHLTGEGSAFRFAEPMVVAPIHGFTPDRIPAFDRTLLQGSVVGSYTMLDGGERSGQVDRARAVERLAESDLAAVSERVIAAAVEAYMEVLAAAGRVAAERRRVAALETEAQRVERFLAEGRAARVEVLRVQAALAQANADLATAASRLEVAEAELARRTALERDRVRAVRLVPVVAIPGEEGDRNELQRLMWERHPALQAARNRVAAARAGLRVAAASWLPALRLEGRLVSYGAADAPGSTEWQAGVRFSWPIFTGGRRLAGVDRARAGLQEAEAELRAAELAAASRLDRALAAVVEADRRAEALGSAVTHWTEVVRIEALALAEGAGTQAEYLRAEAELAAVSAALVHARGAQVTARVEVAQAIGGLTPETLAAIVRIEP